MIKNQSQAVSIPDFPGYYISEDGRVLSEATGGRPANDSGIKLHRAGNTPFRARLKHVSGKYRSVNVSRLVFEAFIGQLSDDERVGFRDGNDANLSASNLIAVKKKRAPTFSRVNPEEAADFSAMRAEGKTLMQIAEKASRPYSTIARVLKKSTAM